MSERIYKKMAGTAAVFIPADYSAASPMERDGPSWTADDLKIPSSSTLLTWKPAIDSALALEGLEEYDPPAPGDARYVTKLGMALMYIGNTKSWVGITNVC